MDSFSLVLLVIALLTMTHMSCDTGIAYQLKKDEPRVTHLFFMDDLKLRGKNGKEINSLINKVWHYREDIKIEMCNSVTAERRES